MHSQNNIVEISWIANNQCKKFNDRFKGVLSIESAQSNKESTRDEDYDNKIVQAGWKLQELGLTVIPTDRQTNKPFYGWERLSFGRLHNYHLEGCLTGNNLAVIMGKCSMNLMGIKFLESANPTYLAMLEDLQEYGIWSSISPSGIPTIWLRIEGGFVNSRILGGCQLIGDRQFVVVPPSRTINGAHRWEDDLEPSEIPVPIMLTRIEEYLPGIRGGFVKYSGPRKSPRPVYAMGKDSIKRNNPATWKYYQFANNTPWPGPSGITDWRVFLSLCYRANSESPKNFRATVRDLGDCGGVGKNTANKSIKRLITGGYIAPITAEADGYHYKFTLDVTNRYTNLSSFSVSSYDTAINHDVWRYGALGGCCVQVYSCLLMHAQSEHLLTVSDIVKKTGRSRGAVKNGLRRLEKECLVYCEQDKWGANWTSISDLDNIAQRLNTLGKGLKQKQRHEDERRRYSKQLMDWSINLASKQTS